VSEELTMDDMLEQIITKLHARQAPATAVSSHSVDATDAKEAVRRGEVGLVKAYLHLASDTTNSFYAISVSYNYLRNHGVENPEQYLSARTVHAFISMWDELLDMRADGQVVEASGILCFAAMSGDEDCQIVKHIVFERHPATVEEVKALLAEIKRCTSAVSSGIL